MSDVNNNGNKNPIESKWAQVRKTDGVDFGKSSENASESKKIKEQRGATNPGIGAKQVYQNFAGQILAFNGNQKINNFKKVETSEQVSKDKAPTKAESMISMFFDETPDAIRAFESESNRARAVFPDDNSGKDNTVIPFRDTKGVEVLSVDNPHTLLNIKKAIELADRAA